MRVSFPIRGPKIQELRDKRLERSDLRKNNDVSLLCDRILQDLRSRFSFLRTSNHPVNSPMMTVAKVEARILGVLKVVHFFETNPPFKKDELKALADRGDEECRNVYSLLFGSDYKVMGLKEVMAIVGVSERPELVRNVVIRLLAEWVALDNIETAIARYQEEEGRIKIAEPKQKKEPQKPRVSVSECVLAQLLNRPFTPLTSFSSQERHDILLVYGCIARARAEAVLARAKRAQQPIEQVFLRDSSRRQVVEYFIRHGQQSMAVVAKRAPRVHQAILADRIFKGVKELHVIAVAVQMEREAQNG
ncbi:MAG: hypothetical protein ABIE84_03480 [bacterium]